MANNATKEKEVPYESAGATLLSQQPAVIKTKSKGKEANPEWSTLRGHLEARLNSLYAWRSSWWYLNWSDLSMYLLPRRSMYLTQGAGGIPTMSNMGRGREINQAILDPTGTFAVRVCAAGLMSGLASPSRPWFKVTPKLKNFEPDDAGRQWMDEIENRLYTVLAGSNFYNSFAQECEDLVVFGSSATIIYEDEQDLIRLYNPCIGEYFFASGASLRIDGLYRRFLMTIAQIVDFFGLENCPPDVQKLWMQKGSALQTERMIAHSIEPNFGIGENNAGKIPGNYTWREVYWVYGAGGTEPLSMRGFVDQPFTAARWATQANDPYGRSPGMDVLPDVMQLQVETGRKAEALEKQVRPPLLADAQLKNQPASTLPGEVTYIQNLSATNGMRSIYQVNPDIRGMMEDIKEIQQRIKVGFFNDLFLMLENAPDKDMTATEVTAKLQEKMLVLSPAIENLLTESLRPKLHRIFSILARRKMLPPMPDSMKGIPLDIEFTSVMAIAQKASYTGSLERLAAIVGNMVAVYPEVKDNLDPDKFIREFSEMLAAPQKILRSPQDVEAIRQQAAQKQQAAETMVAMQHGAQTAKIGADAANTLANTNVGSGANALQAIIGGVQ